MRYLYTAVLYLISPLIVLRLYLKSRRLPAYWQRLGERFSWGLVEKKPIDVWIHVVSLGEVVAATPLIQALLDKGQKIMVTTMTPTGSQQVVRQFGSQVAHQYVPYDFPWALRRFLKCTDPHLVIIMETELWPNLIVQVRRAKIPLLLMNARISDRAIKQYMKLRFIFKPILNQFTMILAQSDEDSKRFIALGASAERVRVSGNLKFDVAPIEFKNHALDRLANQWGVERTVIIAASTHNDEEIQLLNALSKIKIAIPGVIMLIAPRHPERFAEVFQLCQQYGHQTALRSKPDSISLQSEIIVLDSLGELSQVYFLCDYAFVGGSLVPVGGHNVLEPIAAHVPVFCGPYMNNSKSICEELSKFGGIMRVVNADDFANKVIEMFQNPLQREQQISNAALVLKKNQGALQTCLNYIDHIFLK